LRSYQNEEVPQLQRLPFGLTAEALAAAEAEPDPGSLAAATRLRTRFGPELAATAASQAQLRRQARMKFGDAAAEMIFTRDGLEQASRPDIADYHAQRFVAAGVRRVFDLGCGIGADAMAFARAGLDVVAVELDPLAAAAAGFNLTGFAEVVCADAETIVDQLGPDDAVFCDPARRTTSGRVWRVEDFRPSWPFVLRLLDQTRTTLVKLGPALPHGLIPDGVDAEWISHRGDTVEVCLSASWQSSGKRSALIWPDHRLNVPSDNPILEVSPPLRYLYEPDGAVIRAGGIPVLARSFGAALLDRSIAYLTSDHGEPSPYATAFKIQEVLPYDRRVLRSWVRAHRVGTLEIKKRGLDVDPAELRRQLRPQGPSQATLILTRTIDGARAVVAERMSPGTHDGGVLMSG
jgi:SAM-dependent methyltransferase